MNQNQPIREGETTKKIEKQTAKIPSDIYLLAAVGSMAASLSCMISGRKHTGLFFGQWASSFLILGLYNKLVKLEGHDAEDKPVDGASAPRIIMD